MTLETAWTARLQLWAEANKIWDEGDMHRAEGSKLWAKGTEIRAEANRVWAEGNFFAVIEDTKQSTERNRLRAENEILLAIGAKHRAEKEGREHERQQRQQRVQRLI